MSQFSGFPTRMQFTPVPNLFFSRLLPEITDMAELKTTLYVFEMLYRKRGYPRFVGYHELLASPGLMRSLGAGEKPEETLRGALQAAVKRGTFIGLEVTRDGASESIYLLNSASERKAADRIRKGELGLPGLEVKAAAPPVEAVPPPDLFALYEQNIGLLTPLIAEELRAAEKTFPEAWIRDAIREAVNYNKRKWSYISAILEQWQTEGRSDGAHRRDTKEDPDKYIRGKYGHMVQR